MNNAKILYCIIHTKNQPDRYNHIMSTWGRDVSEDILFYSDHENLSESTIKVSDRSDYASGEHKQVNVISVLQQNPLYHKYDWYFFCDNDTFVNTINLDKFASACDSNKVHGLVANSWPKDPTLNYCGGGAGFLLSRPILNKIHNNIIVQNTGYGDVTIGLCFRSLGIELQHHSVFHSFPPNHYSYSMNDLNQQITFHYITNYDMMSTLYENTKSYS